MEKTFLLSQLEAVLFAAGEPLAVSKLAQARSARLKKSFAPFWKSTAKSWNSSAWVPASVAGGLRPAHHQREHEEVVKEALQLRKNAPLSNAALEVLAIVAYNQPVTKSFVEQVRGVDSSSIVNSLTEKELLQEAGAAGCAGPSHPVRNHPQLFKVLWAEQLRGTAQTAGRKRPTENGRRDGGARGRRSVRTEE